MKFNLQQEVGVVTIFSARMRAVAPYMISVGSKDYIVGKVGNHQTVHQRGALHHIYEVIDDQERMQFRLNFDTSNMHWTLETVRKLSYETAWTRLR